MVPNSNLPYAQKIGKGREGERHFLIILSLHPETLRMARTLWEGTHSSHIAPLGKNTQVGEGERQIDVGMSGVSGGEKNSNFLFVVLSFLHPSPGACVSGSGVAHSRGRGGLRPIKSPSSSCRVPQTSWRHLSTLGVGEILSPACLPACLPDITIPHSSNAPLPDF